MTDLGAHGISVTLPSGWEGRVFRRPSSGEVGASSVDGPPAPPGETTHAIVHVATIPLPADLGDFGSAAVPDLGPLDAFVMLVEYDPSEVTKPLFALSGVPRSLSPDDFSPSVMQRRIEGQAGCQVFCNEAGRAFCLYVVIGSFNARSRSVKRVNDVLSTLDVGGSGARAPGSSTTQPAGANSTTPGTTSTSTTSTPATTSTTSTTTPSSTTTPAPASPSDAP
jgi:hypothetical protein